LAIFTINVLATASTPMSTLDAKGKHSCPQQFTKKHISGMQQQQLKALIFKFEHLFDRTLGNWKTDSVSIKLKEGAKHFQLLLFPVPRIHKDTLKGNNNYGVTYKY
jgi:hypothetical protein